MTFEPQGKIRDMLRLIIDDPGLRIPRVYNVPSTCGFKCGANWATLIVEHENYIRFKEKAKSAVAEHVLMLGHKIEFDETNILNQTKIIWDSIILDVVEIRTCSGLLNTDSLKQGLGPSLISL